jgi:hypothetical protein
MPHQITYNWNTIEMNVNSPLGMTDPQKQYADAVIEVLPTQLIPDDNEGKVLRVKLIMKEGVKFFNPVYLFDEGSTINWIPCGRKLTCSYPGIKFSYGPDTYFGQEVIHLGLFPLLHPTSNAY